MIEYKIEQDADFNFTTFYLTITYQKYRNRNFYCNDDYYMASNGIELVSCGSPDWEDDDRVLFVRGNCPESDDAPVLINIEDIQDVIDAIEEYNVQFE